MPAVDDSTGAITTPETRKFAEVKKGYTYFEEGDVIFAKITPCMQNGKHAIAKGLIDGIAFGSTEFHVIKPGPKIAAEWIHYFVRQPSVLNRAELAFTGSAGQQRVPKDFLSELEIPLPPLEEQYTVLEAVNQQMAEVDKARAATEAQLKAINSLPAALLRQAFSGQLANQEGNSSASDLRGFIGSYIVHHLHNRPTFGVTQLMKVLYMAQVYFGLNLAYTFGRGQYGPFDKAVYDLEAQAEQNGWFEAHEERKPRYEVLEDISAQLGEAEKFLGDKKSSFVKFLSEVSGMDTKMLEAVATLYAAWNDLLLDGQTPTDKEILAEVLERWPGKAENFLRGELSIHLAQLKELGYIPTGTGQSTRLNHAA